MFIFFKSGFTFGSLDVQELINCIKNSTIQASLSAFFSVQLGFLGALALVGYNKKTMFKNIVLLSPNFVPSLFVIISSLTVITKFGNFPYGILGVVLIHVFINIGFCSWWISNIINNEYGDQIKLAQVEGASPIFFVRKILVKSMIKDLSFIFLFIFTICFNSFAIPLMVGGAYGATLEVLIYEKIKFGLNFKELASLSVVQLVIIYFASILIISKNKNETKKSIINSEFFNFSYLFVIPLISFAMCFLGLFMDLFKGYSSFVEQGSKVSELFELGLQSLSLGLFTGFFVLILLVFTLYALPSNFLQKALLGFSQPSSVLIGLFLILIGLTNNEFIASVIGLGCISYPFCYRLFLESSYNKLLRQVEVAKCMSASKLTILYRVLLPQLQKKLFFVGALSGTWAVGDFALTRVIATNDFTLALKVSSLLKNYRLELASFYIWVLILCCLCLFLFFWSLSYVFDKESKV